MVRRIDPEALFGFILNRWGNAVAAQVCPEVAEPERPEPVSDRCDCAMFGFTHTRMECDEYRDKSAEPVIDEAVYEAGKSTFWKCQTGNSLGRCIEAAIRKYEELNRAVADAQFEKARVTISEAEIDAAVREILSFRCRAEIVKALLRSKGVEVTP